MTFAEPGIRVEQVQGSLLLVIDRQQAGNSLSLPAAKAMRDAFATTRTRTDLHGIVLTGEGGKFFCAGGDLKAYSALRTPDQLSETFDYLRELLREIEQHPLLVIAAIDGYALGGGAELALACDMRIASPSTTIGFPQSALGIIPGWNGVERLVRIVGPGRATRLLLDASRLSAYEALEIGLVDLVASGETARERALSFLSDAPAAPLAVRAIKEAVRVSCPTVPTNTTAAIFERLWFSEDHREAEQAFKEKRRPVFIGS